MSILLSWSNSFKLFDFFWFYLELLLSNFSSKISDLDWSNDKSIDKNIIKDKEKFFEKHFEKNQNDDDDTNFDD